MTDLPKLDYDYDALEPHIDAKTMEIHHSKHHQAYINKFDAACKDGGIEGKDVDELLKDLSAIDENIRGAIRDHGGGHSNHRLFWKSMSPKGGGEPAGPLAEAIAKHFGDLASFKETFGKAAKTRFGSGWAWLVQKADGTLEVMSTANQDSPLSESKNPLLGLDVWEHAYYLKYQNKRPDYIEAFWNVVDWDAVAERFSA